MSWLPDITMFLLGFVGLLLIFIILLQRGRGGGLAGALRDGEERLRHQSRRRLHQDHNWPGNRVDVARRGQCVRAANGPTRNTPAAMKR